MSNPQVTPLLKQGNASADNAVMCVTDDVSGCVDHIVGCSAGALTIEGCWNAYENNGATPNWTWTDEATFALAMLLLNTTDPGTWVTSLTAGQIARVIAPADRLRIKQAGGTPSVGFIKSYPR